MARMTTMSDPLFTPFAEIPETDCAGFRPWMSDSRIDAAPPVDEFARGLEEGQATAMAAFAAERRALQALVASAVALQPADFASAEQLIVDEVERLVRDIVGSAPVDRVWLQDQAHRIIEMASGSATPTLCVHPDDRALLDDAEIKVDIRNDAALPRGTVRLETGDGVLDCGRAAALDALHRQLAGREYPE